jgi:hypothetical protein
MTFYTGNKLPKWKGDIFVGGQRTGEIPGTGHLERVLVNEMLAELRREALLIPLRMRLRDVRQVPTNSSTSWSITRTEASCGSSHPLRRNRNDDFVSPIAALKGTTILSCHVSDPDHLGHRWL